MFLIIQNDPEVPAGSCAPLLESSGQEFQTVAAYGDHDFPDPSFLAGVIVLGGEMGVHDTVKFPYLLRVGAFISAAIEAGTPLLGICLGGQLLAHVAGGEVTSRSPFGEKGICRIDLNNEGAGDPLFSGIDRTFLTFQLHNDSFTVPPGGVLLASSDRCPAQAFRLRETVYGLQFHPEVDRSIVSSWGAFSTPPLDFLPGFLVHECAFRAASRAIIANFITLADASGRS